MQKISNSIAIVHGHKSHPDGSMKVGFRLNLDFAVVLASVGGIEAIIVSGGQTRQGFKAEAIAGKEYLKGKVEIPILPEARSRSSSENVRFTKESYEVKIQRFDRIYIISRRSSSWRIKLFYRRFWPKVYKKARFIATAGDGTKLEWVMEPIYLFFALVDPHEKWLARVVKLLMRNSKGG